MQRYFRCPSVELYESIRLGLDAAWGHPNAIADTCFEPAETAHRDSVGRLLLAVRPEFCDYAAVAAMLPELLASGAVDEIDEATYMAAVNATP